MIKTLEIIEKAHRNKEEGISESFKALDIKTSAVVIVIVIMLLNVSVLTDDYTVSMIFYITLN